MWYPRLNYPGTRLTGESAGEWQNQWLTDDVEIFQDGTHTLTRKAGGVATTVVGPPANVIGAQNGRFALWNPTTGITTDQGVHVATGCFPGFLTDGRLAYLLPYQSSQRALLLDNVAVTHGLLLDARTRGNVLAWRTTTGIGALVKGTVITLGTLPFNLFGAVPVELPDGGAWVLNYTDTGVILREATEGNVLGYRFDNGGQTYYPDATYLVATNAIRVVFSDDRGTAGEHVFDLGVPVGSLMPPPPPPPGPIMLKPAVIFDPDPRIWPKIVKGTAWSAHVHDGNNPGYGATMEIDAKGELHITLTNPAGSDRSGKPRQVL